MYRLVATVYEGDEYDRCYAVVEELVNDEWQTRLTAHLHQASDEFDDICWHCRIMTLICQTCRETAQNFEHELF